MSVESRSYVLSRVPHRYEDLVGQLSKKKQAVGAMQLLALFPLDDSAVAPLVKLATTESSKALQSAAHQLLRQASTWVAASQEHALSVEALESLAQSKDRGAALAALWTLASFARFASHPRRTVLAGRVTAQLVQMCAREADTPADALCLYGALSACLSLQLDDSLASAQVQVWDAALKCLNSSDPVAVRHALSLMLERSRKMEGSCSSIVVGLLSARDQLNLSDMLARVYWVQLCGLDISVPLAQQCLEEMLDDVSFRVVSEAISVLCKSLEWAKLPLGKMVAPVLVAFQSPRPVLHFSGLEACAWLAEAKIRGDTSSSDAPQTPTTSGRSPLAQLIPLVNVQLQNDSVYHRWRALKAMIWLSGDPVALLSLLVTEVRSNELTADLLCELFTNLEARAACCLSTPWADVLLQALNVWLSMSPKSIDPDAVARCWRTAMRAKIPARQVVGSLFAFLEYRFESSSYTLAQRLRLQAAQFIGHFYALLVYNDKVSTFMIGFLEKLVLANCAKEAAHALVLIAARTQDVSVRQRIQGFFGLFSTQAGFDSAFVTFMDPLRAVVDAACQEQPERILLEMAGKCGVKL